MNDYYHDADKEWFQTFGDAMRRTEMGQNPYLLKLSRVEIERLQKGELIVFEINGEEFHVMVQYDPS